MSLIKILKVRKRKTKQGNVAFLGIQDDKIGSLREAGFLPGGNIEVAIDPGVITIRTEQIDREDKSIQDYASMPSRQRSSIPVFCCVTPAGVDYVPKEIQERLLSHTMVVDENERELPHYRHMLPFLDNEPLQKKEPWRGVARKVFMTSRKFLNKNFAKEAEELCVQFIRRKDHA